MPKWLREDFILQAHRVLFKLDGGLDGACDRGRLAATLARPHQLVQYEGEATIFRLAACYAFGLARNHCFSDGNKRIAYAAMRTFLKINGMELKATQDEKVQVMLALAAGEIDEESLAVWLESHCA